MCSAAGAGVVLLFGKAALKQTKGDGSDYPNSQREGIRAYRLTAWVMLSFGHTIRHNTKKTKKHCISD